MDTIIAWNVDGYDDATHVWIKRIIEKYLPSIIFLSETKRSYQSMVNYLSDIDSYDKLINDHSPTHYHGVAMLIRSNLKYEILDIDLEIPARYDTNSKYIDGKKMPPCPNTGRLIAVEFSEYIVLGTYSPNSGIHGLKNLDYRIEKWDKALFNTLETLKKEKDVMWLGDINVAPETMDVSNPEKMCKYAGFTIEERNSLKSFLDKGWVDIWRKQHPDIIEYSWIGHAQDPLDKEKLSKINNTSYGMRLDSFIVTPDLEKKIKHSFMIPQCICSDHIPVGICIDKS